MCYSILVEQDLKLLEKQFGASPVRTQFEHYEKLTHVDPKHFKPMSGHARIYPNYFAPVIASRKGANWILPMRYRVRPAGSTEEIPSKYNVFNARVDALTSRRTWSKLLGRQHGILVFREFYEWITPLGGKQKKVFAFHPNNHADMWAPVLWDWWESDDKSVSYFSFAVITGEPPAQILDAGHDRCPIFLKKERVNDWLNPGNASAASIIKLLDDTIQCDWTAREATP